MIAINSNKNGEKHKERAKRRVRLEPSVSLVPVLSSAFKNHIKHTNKRTSSEVALTQEALERL